MADQVEKPETDIPDELVVTLRKPVTIGSESYAQLLLREPTAGEIQQWDNLSGTEADIFAIALISGVPKPAIEKIGARDLKKSAEYLASFL